MWSLIPCWELHVNAQHDKTTRFTCPNICGGRDEILWSRLHIFICDEIYSHSVICKGSPRLEYPWSLIPCAEELWIQHWSSSPLRLWRIWNLVRDRRWCGEQLWRVDCLPACLPACLVPSQLRRKRKMWSLIPCGEELWIQHWPSSRLRLWLIWNLVRDRRWCG